MTAPQTARNASPARNPGSETGPRPSAPVAAGPVSPQTAGGPFGGSGGPLVTVTSGPETREGTGALVITGRCACGHLDVFHNLGTRCGVNVRTRCDWGEGPQLTSCGCKTYQEAA